MNMPGLLMITMSAAFAQDVSINIDDNVAGQFGIDSDEASSGITSSIDSSFNINDQAEFLQSMANAAAMSSKGMGVDYASNIKRFMFGVSFGSAVNSAGFQFGRGDRELPEGGFALQLSGMAGLNLGFANQDSFLSRVKIYVNGLTLSTTGDFYDASMYNVGTHLQIQLAKPRSAAVVAWGGLALTSGYDLSTYSIGLSQEIPVETDLDGSSLTWSATGAYDVTANTASVPIELSTNLRIALFTLYVGGGVDWNDGAADSEISLSGPLEVSASGQTATLGAASVSLTDSALADEFTPRVFGGIQTGFAFMQVYGHLNIGLNDSVGGHLGARLAF
jgi:hypothetical protein